uniref:NAD-dependent epimerase/dehydratase domain-containing protein n=1 Tax=Aureoumbra lagunensis TaxID=44058 RepID=A0A6S8D6Z0_9STRA|mmetsp:Transcript_5049/g.7119  ORF Transcript_5049/g.7119 Transcript_5049/m.7119 type:complete len:557 (+) Transcript_5049:152-1822(+)|eukprot:CAMPEP_0197285844 /NCGR_PEP_ID=MMETSP0890-20130614/1168_1 /TAXON_ID=44058 ORGANISM="Aureoumbra lagunensis, Strain CCMP1510" /NCGR_SAMPLE_ID=MMETSP0890 /ASSEMBLY_ACC=CAM_ASM_000533 /LENGTH=556 /DNA_ID=CAMNT_0042753687 /DNA_START=151 /DNA_END=1821 /DNA_ORIENTATION=+
MDESQTEEPETRSSREEENGDQRIVLVVGGLGLLGNEVCEKLLLRGNTVICCDELPPENNSPVPSPSPVRNRDAVNGSKSLAEKTSNLRRLQRISKENLRYVYLGKRERTALTVRAAVAASKPTDLVLLGLCGREDGGEIAYGALRQFQGKSAVVASSAAVYDTSAGGARRGGSSARTHTRPLLSESDAIDDGGQNLVAASTWRVERAVAKASSFHSSVNTAVTRVAVLRFFGVFGGRTSFARHLAQRLRKRIDSPIHTPEPEGVSNLLDVERQGAYGCADFCAVSDAAEACLRTLDAFRDASGPPGTTAVNVGVGKAHRAEHVVTAAAKALAVHGLCGDLVSSNTSTSGSGLLQSKFNSKSCPADLAFVDARAGFAAADVSKLRALVGWVPASRLDTALAREVARSVERDTDMLPSFRYDVDQRTIITTKEKENATSQIPTQHILCTTFTDKTDEKCVPSVPAPLEDKNRSLAALDLSSCVASNLLQVSARVRPEGPTSPRAPLASNSKQHENDVSAISRQNQKQRFFQLNQLTSLPGRAQNAVPLKKPSLRTIF